MLRPLATAARAALATLLFAMPAVAAQPWAAGGALIGKVAAPDGRAIGGALVSIVGARPRAGATLASPWCYPDCGRHTLSRAGGQFVIAGVDPAWLYDVHVEAAGYPPQTVELNPRSELPMTVRLFTADDPASKVVGRVLEPDGAPAAGALVRVESFTLEGSQTGECQIDRELRTDDDGQFAIRAARP